MGRKRKLNTLDYTQSIQLCDAASLNLTVLAQRHPDEPLLLASLAQMTQVVSSLRQSKTKAEGETEEEQQARVQQESSAPAAEGVTR